MTWRRPSARLLAAVAALCALGALLHFSARAPAQIGTPAVATGQGGAREVAQGRALFVQSCSACHGFDARGVPHNGPSLRGVGAQAADFYVSTGRMPLNNPRDAPVRSPPAFPPAQIHALVAYIGSFGGPPIPQVDPRAGSLPQGLEAFTTHCAGCHQVGTSGGIVTGAVAPPLHSATATQVAEALRIGPYLMPNFSTRQIDQQEVNSLARYVLHNRHPTDIGGWGIGHIGPIPEGMIAWFLAAAALLVVARLIGERSEV